MPAPSGCITDLEQPAVRVFTLGRFEIEVNHAPLRVGRKAQRRPLDLLKLLVAYGGEAVSTEQLAEDLWPDSEGDAALAALRTTVSRLRKLLGATAIRNRDRALALNPEVCWVDAVALAQRLADCRPTSQESGSADAHAALEDALSLYRGDFLRGDCSLPAVLATRARLHNRVLRHVADFGRSCEQRRQFDRALDVYRKGLEIDPAAEEIARRAMQCCRSCARCTEGIAVYLSLQQALRSRLGVEPSASTRAVYDELLRESASEAERFAHAAAARVTPVIPAGPSELCIGVLPFEDLSPRRDHHRLAVAVREAIVSLLGAVPQLSLVTNYRPGIDGGGIFLPSSEKTAVRYLLRGSVMVSGRRLRAGIHLIDTRTGGYAWSEQLDHTLGNVIEAQDQIAIKTADGLAAKLLGHYPLVLLKPDIQLWKALRLAVAFLNRQGRQDCLRARALISRLMESKDPELAVLAVSATIDVSSAWRRLTADPEGLLRTGEQKLRRIRARYGYEVQGMPSLAWACALRGDFGEAILHGRSIVDRMPESFMAHAFLGMPLQYKGLHAQALDKMHDAFRACPQPPHWLYKDRAVAQFCLGRYDEAARGLATALVDEFPKHREANLLDARMMYVASLAASGRIEQARHEASLTLARDPTVTAGDWCEWHFHPFRVGSPAQRIERLLVAAGLPH